MEVVDGKFRFLTFKEIEDNVIVVNEFKSGDSIIGIGVLLNARCFQVDNDSILNGHRYYGPEDKIESIILSLDNGKQKKDIGEIFKNDSLKNKMDLSNLEFVAGSGYDFHQDKIHFKSEVYQSFQDLKEKYNRRELEYNYSPTGCSTLSQEIFFWTENIDFIKSVSEGVEVEFTIRFNDRLLTLRNIEEAVY